MVALRLCTHRIHHTTDCAETQEKFLKKFQKLTLGTQLHQFLGLGLGQLGVVAGLHGVVATALGLGTQVGGIAEHLGQRHIGVNLDSTGTGDLAQDVTTAGNNIANDSTHILIRNGNARLMYTSLFSSKIALTLASSDVIISFAFLEGGTSI